MRWPWQRPPLPPPSAARKRLDAVITLCRQLQGTGHQAVPIVRILELADPEGQEELDPRADPVTGTLPVTPIRPEDQP